MYVQLAEKVHLAFIGIGGPKAQGLQPLGLPYCVTVHSPNILNR